MLLEDNENIKKNEINEVRKTNECCITRTSRAEQEKGIFKSQFSKNIGP